MEHAEIEFEFAMKGTSMVKRLKALLICGIAVMSLALLTGCSFSLPETSYTPPEKTPVVSAPAIKTDGVLTVGVNASSAPLAGQPSNSTKIVGVDVDVAAALADYLGLKLEIVDVGSDPAAALADGKVDIVMGVNNASTQSDFWLSESYLPTGVALFAPAAITNAPAADTTDKIAAQVSSKSAWAVANAYKGAQVVTTDTLENSFASLASGEVQYVASDLVIGTYAAHASDADVHVVALLQAASGYCIGVSDSNTELKQYVSDALASLIDGGVIKVIEMKWLGTVIDVAQIPVVEVASANADKDDEESKDEESSDSEEEEKPNPAETNSNQSETNAAPASQPA